MPHAGDRTPAETYDLLEQDPAAVLVDVRTRAEWTYVGVPDLRRLGRQALLLEWQSYPDGVPNREFLQQLGACGVQPDVPVAFICRSGVRSLAAARAATAAGYRSAYNVVEGFEGSLDEDLHRGGRRGWKAAGLPWTQT